jgi:hypothetical protein
LQPGQLKDNKIAMPIMKRINCINTPRRYFQNSARIAVALFIFLLLFASRTLAADISGE